MAIFGVISLHVFLIWPKAEIVGIRILSFSEIIRYAVPIFLMLSGALLLNRKMSISNFLKRRIPRLIVPFCFYLVLYVIVLFFLISNFNYFNGLNEYLSYVPLSFNWYFWMILGVYFSIPIVDIFIRNAKMSEIEYFILMMLIGSILYQFLLFFKIISFIDFNFFVSPLSFIILGYYLSIKEFKISSNKLVLICSILIIITTILKMSGIAYFLEYNLVFNYEATRSAIVSSHLDLGILEIIRAGSLFLIIKIIYQYSKNPNSQLKNFLNNRMLLKFNESVSKSSYGMYLFHHTLIDPIKVIAPLLSLTGTQTFILIILISFLVFLICWFVVLLFNKIPFINKLSGYH